MSNRKLGNSFESELCEILFNHGFWCHNLAQNQAGQPADVIAVRNRQAYLIDCKVCSSGFFTFSRLEDNQILSMDLWKDSGNGTGWFAVKFDDRIYMMPSVLMTAEALSGKSRRKENWFQAFGTPINEWMGERE
jgi:Holliday junction resolvase